MTAALKLIDTLLAAGIENATCVPGESYLAVLDAIYERQDRFRLITCRQEGGAATMAEAMGRLTGKPGVCFVTRGPGATNASIGVHNAKQNGTPMLLFVGQIALGDRGREAFQEVDFEAMFAPLAKWAVEILDGARMVEITSQAIRVALSGRPGPVVIGLPEDMLSEVCDAAAIAPFLPPPQPCDVTHIRGRLAKAQRPLAIIGGSTWDQETTKSFTKICENAAIPIVTSFRRQSLIDHRSPAYAGVLGLGPDPKLVEKVKAADCILALGTRLGDIVSQGYSLFKEEGGARLIHICDEATDLGRVFPVSEGLIARPSAFVSALQSVEGAAQRRKWFETARHDYEAFRDWVPEGLALNPAKVMQTLRRKVPDNAIITNGAGNFAIWAHRYFPLHGFNCQLGPVSGAMGYALPAALGAAALYPERSIIAATGDGDFMMTVQELATAAQYGLKVIILLLNNGMYGTIRMHQERHFPGRISATELANPDFVALAKAHGLDGAVLDKDANIDSVLDAAIASPTTFLIEMRHDKAQITPAQRLVL